MLLWTGTDLLRAQKILKQTKLQDFSQAVSVISADLDREVTVSALRAAFLRNGLTSPSAYCKKDSVASTKAPAQNQKQSPLSDSLKKLVELTRKGPQSFSALCDKLDLSPAKTKQLIENASAQGVNLQVEHDHVGIKAPEADERVKSTGIAPVVGQRQKIAVISDTHLGSKYCLREQLKEFIHYAYSQGVREILHPGDVLDGMYRHGTFEVSHTGLDEQTQDLFETLPQLPGLTYHGITGNHDATFMDQIGVDVGHFITNYFAERGRHDFKFYGNRGAFLKIRGAVVHLWHPRSGGSYARSYGIQKQIEKYSSIKPQILLTGHWHIYCSIFERGIHAIACPTFQGGGSAFGKSLGGAPAIGGMILSWDLTKDNTLRSFIHEYRAYFENERPVQIYNNLDATSIAVNEPSKKAQRRTK